MTHDIKNKLYAVVLVTFRVKSYVTLQFIAIIIHNTAKYSIAYKIGNYNHKSVIISFCRPTYACIELSIYKW